LAAAAAAKFQRLPPPPYRLHLACGKVALPGWINIDQVMHDTVDILWDLRRPLPVADGCAEFVFHEHFLEHLTVQDGLALLRECRRLLMPGGVLRVAMPDLTECVRQYWEDDWRRPWMQKYGYEWIQTRAECLNIAFRDWQHQWLYDREELHRRLTEVGFAELRDCRRLESSVPGLCNLETRDESLLVCEAVR
jgi:predicted SAM-dependent methyltransferase